MASETKQKDYRDGWRAGQKWASTRQVLELDDLAEAMENRTTWWHPVLVKGGQTTSIERMFASLIREISPNAATWVALVAATIDEWTNEGGSISKVFGGTQREFPIIETCQNDGLRAFSRPQFMCTGI